MTTRTDGPDQSPSTPPGDEPAGQWEEDLLEDWIPQRRTNRLTALLAAAVLALGAFTVGALVQRQYGASATSAAAGPAGLPAGGFEGLPGQGRSGALGQGGFPDAPGASVAAGTPGVVASSSAVSGASDVPVVVGTVKSVTGENLVVENFAGTSVTVHVPASATVTTPGLTSLAAGMTVSVVGKAGADGSVTASAVTARRAP